MKFPLLLIFLIYCSSVVFGQVGSDTLWSVWKDDKQPTAERLIALEKICKKQYLYSQPDSAYLLAKIGYEFAEKEALKENMSDVLKIMGIACAQLSRYEEAIDLQKQGIEISQVIKDDKRIAKHLKNIGNVYLKMSNYSAAIDTYSQGLKIAEEIEDRKLIASFQNNIALVYFDLKDYDKALELLKNALLVFKEIDDKKGGANALNNIGTIYRKQGNYEKALEYYERSLQLKLDNNTVYGLPICYSNLGLTYRKQGNSKKALEYYNLSIDLQKKAKNYKGIARSLINFGKTYQSTNPDTTISLLNQAIEIARKTNNKEEQYDASDLLYQTYRSKGKYKEALEVQEIAQELKDSMNSVENQKALLAYEYKLEHEKALIQSQLKYEQELYKTQSRSQRNQFIIIAVTILLGLMIGFYIQKKYSNILSRRKELLNKVETLKEKLATQTVSSIEKRKELSLDKVKIEAAIDNKIGESSWLILNLIFENPSISNKEIAEKVSLSVEGVSSSLRRMYTAFGVKGKGNKKVTLLMKAVNISVQA